ncbi:MAG: thioredoxin domain-containing protein [Acidobacteria bacterium]|nr:thioredoxin domain-containing protein [Acidobacteriota bacterium]
MTAQKLMRNFDTTHGGFGRAPKFPPSMTMSFLLRQYARTKDGGLLAAIELTLDKMACGGMYDQLGGGFHRYSVDERWLAPHFEKMLYDNALLSRLYLDAWLVTQKPFYRQIVEEILDYVIREMTNANGGFYSTQDADSEGEEGKFFVWTPAEITALLSEEDARMFCAFFDVTEAGNFEEANILHVDDAFETVAERLQAAPERLQQALHRGREILFQEREKRIKPFRDEKMLTAWNGLMMRSFAEAAQVLGRTDYLEVARRNAEFVMANLCKDGRLLRTHKNGVSKLNAYVEDYAYLADGLLALYEATFDVRWFNEARQLTDTMIAQFWDEQDGGFFFTSHDHETLISRTKDFYDNATPSGNSVAAHVLLRLHLFTGEARYRELAGAIFALMKNMLDRAPSGFGHLLCALDTAISTPYEIAVVGNPNDETTAELLTTVFQRYLPNKVVAYAAPDDAAAFAAIPLLTGRTTREGKAQAYVCRQFTCAAPVTEAAALEAQLTAERY